MEHDDGAVLVTAPDFPELTTFGDDRAEAIERAVGALEEAVAARISARQDIPVPSQGKTRVSLPTLTAVKVILYQGMRDLSARQNWPAVSVGTCRRWIVSWT